MKKGKLIIIEGTDCSGKQTQTELLIKNLRGMGILCENLSFPMYDTPTGKIIAGPYLAKPQYGIEGYFPEGAVNVPAQIACLYYAADRKYNIDKIENLLKRGVNVILDRYVESNMAHQGSKAKTKEEQDDVIKFIDTLEYDLLKLPRPDLTILLYMPTNVALILKANREELPDQHESCIEHLKKAENTYLYLAKKYGFPIVNCSEGTQPRSRESISKEVLSISKNFLTNNLNQTQ